MLIKQFDYLPEHAIKIRKDVFVTEQGFIDEFDEYDTQAKHFVGYINDIPVATCRTFFNPEVQSHVVGRIAVIREYRGKGLGNSIIKAAEDCIKEMGGKKAMLSAQVRVSDFYKKQGYMKQGDVFMDQDCPHIWMDKEL
jgi:predicted GNAT family N-acyltransferase